ncbi:MAG: hypothetical protein R3F65_18645 [bacterium]|nr:hypothetical protein [Myxococcales bacterium]MCB9543260.1 hypothetical protein [Myxococcales bacterium]MCB9551880.1 hypothetical protein [Myxococcales bacterium]
MDGGHGYGVRIRQPAGAAEDWAADLSTMIAPIIGEEADALEDALKRGELTVAHGLPLDEARQLVGVFQGLGAEAEVVDSPGREPTGGLKPLPGDRPPAIAGTAPFNMAGLRKALEAASRPAAPAPAEPGPPPVMAPPPRVSGSLGDEARANQTRPFDPSMVRAALARSRADEDPLASLPGLSGSDFGEDDEVPTAVAGPDGRRRKGAARPGGAGGFGQSLMGVVGDEPAGAPGATQSFGAGIFEPPPPPRGAEGSYEGPPPAGSYDGPPPRAGESHEGPPPPDRAALAGFTSPGEQFDPAAVRRLRDDLPRRRGFGGADDLIGPGAFADFDAEFEAAARNRRGASIADKPTDRLLMPPGMEGGRLHDRPTVPRGDLGFDGLPPLPELPPRAGSPMVVQLEAPVVDPSETGTFTREASLDPLPEDEEETRQIKVVDDRDVAPARPTRGTPMRGVRPGVYRLGEARPVTEAPRIDRPGMPAAGAAILSTGQMVARPVARSDEEVTDSGSFRIVQRDEAGKSKRPPRPEHSPVKAGLLALLPGMGQVYNGQRDRGIVVALASIVILPWLWSIFDAVTTAAAIRRGDRPAPDPRAWQRGRWGQLLLDVAVVFSVVVGVLIWQGMNPPAPAPPPIPAPAPSAPPAAPGPR